MSTMSELLKKLTEREKARFAAEQEAQGRMRAAEAQVTKATEQLMELKRAQEQELRVIKAVYEKRFRDAAYHHRQRVHKSRKELSEQEALADSAEKRQRSAEAHVMNLSQKLNDLQAQLQRRSSDAEAGIAGLERLMENRVERVSTQANDRIRGMHVHATQVCEAAGTAVESTVEELQDQMARAHIRAEGRVRFKELCELAKSHNNFNMSKEAYHGLKAELISLWHTQSLESRSAAASPTSPPASQAGQRQQATMLMASFLRGSTTSPQKRVDDHYGDATHHGHWVPHLNGIGTRESQISREREAQGLPPLTFEVGSNGNSPMRQSQLGKSAGSNAETPRSGSTQMHSTSFSQGKSPVLANTGRTSLGSTQTAQMLAAELQASPPGSATAASDPRRREMPDNLPVLAA